MGEFLYKYKFVNMENRSISFEISGISVISSMRIKK